MSFETADEFDAQTFKNLKLDDQEVRGKTFHDCTFVHCSFHETAFLACSFQQCSFEHCDLSLMTVKASRFQDVAYTHCQLAGVDWSMAAPARLTTQTPLRFTSCSLNYTTFTGAKLKGACIRDCIARDVDFSETDLENADCRGTDFSNSRFQNTNLGGADFRGACNYLISPTQNRLKGAHFSLPEAIGLLYGLEIILDNDPDLT